MVSAWSTAMQCLHEEHDNIMLYTLPNLSSGSRACPAKVSVNHAEPHVCPRADDTHQVRNMMGDKVTWTPCFIHNDDYNNDDYYQTIPTMYNILKVA